MSDQPQAQPSKAEGPLIAILSAIVVVLIGLGIFALTHDSAKKSDVSSTPLGIPSVAPSDSSDSTSSTDSTGSSSGSTASAPNGYTVVHDDTDGASFALPDSFRDFDLSSPDAQGALDQMASVNPDLAPVLSQVRPLLQKGGRIFAIDSTAGSGHFADNVNLIVSSGTIDVTDPATATTVQQQLAQLKATNVQTTVVDTPAGKGLQVSYDLPLNLPSGSTVTVHGRQLYVSHGGKVFILTFSAAPDSDVDSTFDVMRGTFTVQ